MIKPEKSGISGEGQLDGFFGESGRLEFSLNCKLEHGHYVLTIPSVKSFLIVHSDIDVAFSDVPNSIRAFLKLLSGR